MEIGVAVVVAVFFFVFLLIVIVEQTVSFIYNIIVGRGYLRKSFWPREFDHFGAFLCSRLGKVMARQSGTLPTTNPPTNALV